MIVKHLHLSDFRKFGKKEFEFSSQLNIILGPNASGKTNILESLFFLATGKSFRAEESSEMISFEEEVGRVHGVILNTFDKLSVNSVKNPVRDTLNQRDPSSATKVGTQDDNKTIELEVLFTNGMVMGVKTPLKKYSINGVEKRMIDFVGNLKVVLFWPQDLELVTDSPSRRRHYLDFVLTQVDREYRRSLLSYEKGLRQRNRVLEAIRDKGAHRQQLIFWDQLLIKAGEYITKKRGEYINFINNFQFSIFNFQSNPKFKFPNYQLIYDKSVISRDRLDQYSEQEVASANTLVGPHRDDFKFSLTSTPGVEARDLSHFGSRGEQRLGILWLKMGELTFIEKIANERPLLLLDDIFSELDHEHRKIIFDIIGNQQTILTTTDEHFIENRSLQELKVIKL